jgi:hypothetical protein
MESFIKEVGLVCIGGASKEARETTMKTLSLDANKHLIDAAYAESLLPSVDEQIAEYEKIIGDLRTQIADIEELASKAPNAQEGYNIRKDKKEIEVKIRSYTQGRDRMNERKASALEKINAHRFDAQAIMHRISFIAELGETALYDQLRSHIEKQHEVPEEIVVTQEILDENPMLVESGVQVGDVAVATDKVPEVGEEVPTEPVGEDQAEPIEEAPEKETK